MYLIGDVSLQVLREDCPFAGRWVSELLHWSAVGAACCHLDSGKVLHRLSHLQSLSGEPTAKLPLAGGSRLNLPRFFNWLWPDISHNYKSESLNLANKQLRNRLSYMQSWHIQRISMTCRLLTSMWRLWFCTLWVPGITGPGPLVHYIHKPQSDPTSF